MRIFITLVFLLTCCAGIFAQSYARGSYIGPDSVQHDGMIAYQIGQSNFHFKENQQAEPQKFNSKEVLSFKWGVETFASKEGDFVRVVDGEGPVVLYEYRKPISTAGINPLIGESQPSRKSLRRTYLLERQETGELITLEWKRKKFQRQMEEFFDDAPELVERVKQGEFEAGDIQKMLRIYRDEYVEVP